MPSDRPDCRWGMHESEPNCNLPAGHEWRRQRHLSPGRRQCIRPNRSRKSHFCSVCTWVMSARDKQHALSTLKPIYAMRLCVCIICLHTWCHYSLLGLGRCVTHARSQDLVRLRQTSDRYWPRSGSHWTGECSAASGRIPEIPFYWIVLSFETTSKR